MRIDCATAQIQGTRNCQEDSFDVVVRTDGALALIADGLGGHRDGAVASRTAVESARSEGVVHWGEPAFLLKALIRADACVRGLHHPAEHLNVPASTLIAAHVTKGCVRFASAGDSLMYIYGDGRLWQADSPGLGKGCLPGFGVEEVVEESMPLNPGDAVILATDGIYPGHAGSAGFRLAMPDLLTGLKTAQEIASAIMEWTEDLKSPNQDNATVMVLRLADP